MPNERDTKLVQWLNEAYAKEAELEASLNAHIALTDKMSYKKRLRQHLTETKSHKRQVASRIKKLGGTPETSNLPGVPSAVGGVAGKAVAAVKGQVGGARAALTKQTETHLRNAQEELREEHVEIAIYRRIQAFATEVGDRETVQLTKAIIREEERMAKFLDAEIGRLVKEVVRSEVPRDQRATTKRRSSSRRGTSSTARRSTGTTSRSTTSRSTTGRSTASRSGTSRSGTGRSGTNGLSATRTRTTASRSRTRGSANGAGRTSSRSTARSASGRSSS
jgi:ferritin-like metal-binding protein YciE